MLCYIYRARTFRVSRFTLRCITIKLWALRNICTHERLFSISMKFRIHPPLLPFRNKSPISNICVIRYPYIQNSNRRATHFTTSQLLKKKENPNIYPVIVHRIYISPRIFKFFFKNKNTNFLESIIKDKVIQIFKSYILKTKSIIEEKQKFFFN